ncbi:iron ABC transporter permease [Ignatzschineria sp. RMDPL8A]|uniref:FecCD family ABC transporter permease n=1 Tax=Ignatzschineria sp. RMDPL8A TaxID=2999236 RepID=UPI0016B595DE|nr:iron ABC transporter permease [Ignatzschineria sp. RMDPL8A]MDG9729294.1 iron ABC transporter permease [Ignatzschineria sp. RMDPL8A]NLD09318.1 iron ABC transporter permease [Xanthomonadaceae bacterium]
MQAAEPSKNVSGYSDFYQSVLRKRFLLMGAVILCIIASLIFDFTLGPSGITVKEFLTAVFNPSAVDAKTQVIVWDLRLSKALMAIVVGFALGLAGAEMQTVLNNPLASPFTLGVSSAASFGAALAIVLGIGFAGIPSQWFVSANAFIFALMSALLLDLVARVTRAMTSGIVLFGIALVFTFNALVSLMQFIATEDTLQGLVFWTMGNLMRAEWPQLGILTLLVVLIFPWSMSNSWKLTAFRLGEDRALSFGINIRKLRLSTLIRISILASVSVAFVGPISFIGLVAPHISRFLFGEDHRFYLPGSALIGALILSLASIASKNILHGVVIPVGIVTSLVGVPFFLTIVLRNRGRI